MASSLRFTTPPPPSSSMRVPQTPRLGYEDDYQPYSPRKSARVSQRQREAHTPPPHHSGHNLRGSQSTPQSLPRSSKRSASATSPSSPQTASKKLARTSPLDSTGRRVSGALNPTSTAFAAAALGIPSPKLAKPEPRSATTSTTRTAGMLPTPAKTPKKRPNGATPAIKSVARTLFSSVRTAADDEVMPSPRKNRNRKKYPGFNLDSFEAEEDDAPIPIYTDSAERIPEVDLSEENPFYVEAAAVQPEPTKLRSHKRKKITVEGEEDQYIEDLEKREDGMVIVFRGKKRFRKFDEVEQEGSEEEREPSSGEDSDLDMPRRLRRPLTRSQIKPRRLFQTAKPAEPAIPDIAPQAFNTEDEEADTDIEDKHVEFDFAATPKAPKFAPSMASPPTTARVTRSAKLDVNNPLSDDETDPVTPSRARRGRLFEDWAHGKSVPGSKKRAGSPIGGNGGTSKRLRS